MRWLLMKDLLILRRSPLLVGLLIAYPIVVAVLIGFALSRGPDRPAVAFLNQVPPSQERIDLGGERVDVSTYSDDLFRSIDPVRVSSRAEALEKVREGEVLGALIIPPDITQKLQAGLEPAEVEVLYNAEDPAKKRFVEDTIKSQVQNANIALTRKYKEIAVDYLGLIVTGGEFTFLGRRFDVLGLERSEELLRRAEVELPAGSPAREDIGRVITFARLARDNLDLSENVLESVGTPIRVRSTVVTGDPSSLSAFAVALAVTISSMFVTVLLAAGTLALEREDNAFGRLVRGLVSRTALLVEKALLAAACSVVVGLLMLAGLGAFVGLDWSRVPLWIAGLAAGGLGFAALGVAIGAIAREVRTASLLAFMVSLPLAFLSLVPSGSVSAALYEAIRVVSALFPFKPTLEAMDAALNDSGEMLVPLLQLAALSLGFGLVARLGLRRFA